MIIFEAFCVLLLILAVRWFGKWSYENGVYDERQRHARKIVAAPLTLVHPVEQPGMPKLIEPDPQDKPVSGHIIFTKNLPRKRGWHGRFVKKTN